MTQCDVILTFLITAIPDDNPDTSFISSLSSTQFMYQIISGNKVRYTIEKIEEIRSIS